jgi:hypothetical protein
MNEIFAGVGVAMGMGAAAALGIVALIYGFQFASKIGGQFFPKGSFKGKLSSLFSIIVVFTSFAYGTVLSEMLGLMGSALGDLSLINAVKLVFGYGIACGVAYLAGKVLAIGMKTVFGEAVQ